jgi:hypothetical protein
MGWTMVRQVTVRAFVAAVVAPVMLGFGMPSVATAAETRPIERPGSLTPNQLFGGRTLTVADALAACGPAAAVAFSKAVGRPVSLDRAVAVARTVGWTPARGMSGPYGEVALLQRLGIPVTIEAGLDMARIRLTVQAGQPVIIRTSGLSASVPGHYFVAERFDPSTGRLDLAQSALVLRSAAGRRWFTLNEISSLGTGTPTHTIYLQAGARSTATLAAASARPFSPVATRETGRGGRVVETGGRGARLRALPGLDGAVIGSAADGTRLDDAGATMVVEGRTWRKVIVAGGTTAWIDSALLRAN